MSTANWLIWAIVLILQNASFTLVSRARNSGSLAFHALASIPSNGIWYISMFFVVGTFTSALMKTGDIWQVVFGGVFYTFFTMIGSVFMHWFSMRFLEKGKRKVGS